MLVSGKITEHWGENRDGDGGQLEGEDSSEQEVWQPVFFSSFLPPIEAELLGEAANLPQNTENL